MKFEIKFRATWGNAIRHCPRLAGLTLLGEARRATGVENLSPDLVDSWIGAFVADPTVEIDEEAARRSGRFLDSCKITVETCHDALTDFASLVPVVSRSDTTGEVTGVIFQWSVTPDDKQRLLSAWEAAGFPAVWKKVKKC